MLQKFTSPTTLKVGLLAILVASAIILHVANSTAAANIRLRPPYTGTYRLTSFFDHHYPNYGNDNEITIYTGESVADCSPHCYKGHSGIDWSMESGTPVLAAASGIVRGRFESNVLYGNRIVLEHDNGYYTLYAHLRVNNPFNVIVGQRVNAGDVIGWSGSTGTTGAHLHFGVYRAPITADDPDEDYATDPFGWRGSGTDPLLNYPAQGEGHTASCLWRSIDADPISCADTIVEDDGEGFTINGAWFTDVQGNGYHMYYRNNTSDQTQYAVWSTYNIHPGPNKVYVYVPAQHATTHQAIYQIVTTSGWLTRTVNQQTYSTAWVLLGIFQLPRYGYVLMRADTGEPGGTTWIAADAIKFCSYADFLPVIFKVEPTATSCGNDC